MRARWTRLIAAVILVLNLVNTMGEFLLSDLVVAAVNQAFSAMNADAEASMGNLGGGMDLGGMLG